MYYYRYPVSIICGAIDDALNEPVKKLIHDMEEELIFANNELLDAYYEGFRHLSKFVTLRELTTSKYSLPHLDPSLFEKYDEYAAYKKEWEKKSLYVSQFLRKVLFKGLKDDEPIYYAEGIETRYERDLVTVLPLYLLELTNLKYDSTLQYIEEPSLHDDWEKIKDIINEMLALRMIVTK